MTKLPVHWSSKIRKKYKRNSIKRELNRAKRIPSHFNEEVALIRKKFINVDFPVRFVNSNINSFINNTEEQEEIEFIIPPYFLKLKNHSY